MHVLLSAKKSTCTSACAPIKRYRNFFAIETIANFLSFVRALCRLLFAARSAVVSTKSVAQRCSLKKSVQMRASSWRSRRCGVAQASFDHLRWCRSYPVCLWVALETWITGFTPSEMRFLQFFRASLFELETSGTSKCVLGPPKVKSEMWFVKK